MDSYDNRLRFTYPVRPGSPQWAALPNRASRLAACEISPELLQRMNTENLLDAVLEHPYLSDVFAFDNVQKGLIGFVFLSAFHQESPPFGSSPNGGT